MEFVQVDVFTDRPYAGNPLAVFPDATDLDTRQMQSIASEMNLSETIFVQRIRSESYDVRIFTPTVELPFAGHPTIGCAWVLRDLGAIKTSAATQRSDAGETPVWFDGDMTWLRRSGESSDDLEQDDPTAIEEIAEALSIDPDEIGADARELGRLVKLRPAFAQAGLAQLMVPVRDARVLEKCAARGERFAERGWLGAYCFVVTSPGHVDARGLWPGAGIVEDPATGSAAAALGLYLAARVGDIEFEIEQGAQMGRPSSIWVRAEGTQVEIGGRCTPVVSGRLEHLP